MGIHSLWEILDPVKEEVSVTESSLINETWAVDLAGWVCAGDCVRAMKHAKVPNAFLR